MRTVGSGMATEVNLPRLGQGMEAGTIVRWLKSEGDAVEKGEPLYELDTDKVTQEVEADACGVLLKIAVAGEGEEIEVGKRIAVIGEQGEERRGRGGEADAEVDEDEQEEGSPAPAREEERERGREARRRSREPEPDNGAARDGRDQGVAAGAPHRARARHRPRDLSGTGPEGRIVAEDVERAAGSARARARPAPRRSRPRSSRSRRSARRSRAGSPRPGRRPRSRSRCPPT